MILTWHCWVVWRIIHVFNFFTPETVILYLQRHLNDIIINLTIFSVRRINDITCKNKNRYNETEKIENDAIKQW